MMFFSMHSIESNFHISLFFGNTISGWKEEGDFEHLKIPKGIVIFSANSTLVPFTISW